MNNLTNRVKRIEKSLGLDKDEFSIFFSRYMDLIGAGNGVIPSRDTFDDNAFRELCAQFPEQARELSRQINEIQRSNMENDHDCVS